MPENKAKSYRLFCLKQKLTSDIYLMFVASLLSNDFEFGFNLLEEKSEFVQPGDYILQNETYLNLL